MKKFTSSSQIIGEIGEGIAVKFLKNKGFSIVERNFTLKLGEIDIIAKKGNQYRFIEVKTFQGTEKESDFKPEHNVHPKKLERFAKTCLMYIDQYKLSEKTPWQIDVIAVTYDDGNKKAFIRHLECIY